MDQRVETLNKNRKTQFQIYVYNIDYATTVYDVIRQLMKCGPVACWNIPRQDRKRTNLANHRGFGFIYFKTREGQ